MNRQLSDTKAIEFISVIIPCYQEKEFIRGCLESLVRQTWGVDNFEVLVIDGMSHDGTREIVREFMSRTSNIRLMDNVKRIAPVAMNMGIQAAKGRYIARIDAHTEVPPEYLERCMEVMRRTGADVVGGPMETRGSGFWGKVIENVLSSFFGVGSSFRTVENYQGYVDTVAFGVYRREVLERVGEHDESLVRGHDWEINQRIKRSGGLIYLDPSIRSIYYCTNSPIQLIKKSFKDGYWIAAIFQKHSTRHLVPFFYLLSIILLALLCYWRRHGLGPWSYVFFPLYTYLSIYYLMALLYSLSMVRSAGWVSVLFGPIMYAAFHLSRGLGTLYGMLTGAWLKGAGNEK